MTVAFAVLALILFPMAVSLISPQLAVFLALASIVVSERFIMGRWPR